MNEIQYLNNLIEKFDNLNEKNYKLFLNETEQKLFSNYRIGFGLSNIKTKKIRTSKNLTKFICCLEKKGKKSSMIDIKNKFGIDNTFKLLIEMNKEVDYNKHKFNLTFDTKKLYLMIDNKSLYYWEIDEFVKRNKLSLSKKQVLNCIKNNKIKIQFKISKVKDHGTIIKFLK